MSEEDRSPESRTRSTDRTVVLIQRWVAIVLAVIGGLFTIYMAGIGVAVSGLDKWQELQVKIREMNAPSIGKVQPK